MGRPMAEISLTDKEASELRGWTRRPTTAQAHGGGAKGASGIGYIGGPNLDCFKPGKHNLTEQFALVSAHGASAVRSALQRAGLQVPGWMR